MEIISTVARGKVHPASDYYVARVYPNHVNDALEFPVRVHQLSVPLRKRLRAIDDLERTKFQSRELLK
jgi:predicted nucleotidyltransferase